jgi:hypothetical protein
MKKKIKQPAPGSNPRRVPELKKGKYSDGHPLDGGLKGSPKTPKEGT